LATAIAPGTEPLDVLVVEDDTAVATEFVDCLSRAGLRCAHAGDGWQALRMVAAPRSIAIVLTDLRMPELDGLQFAEHLQRLGNGTRPEIIFVSGNPGFNDAVRAIQLEARDLLVKPVEPDALVRSVKSALLVRALRAASTGDNATNEVPATPVQRNKASLQSLRAVRRIRSRYFPSELFSDPCWEMLLDLYDCLLSGQNATVTSLAAASGATTTTAWRRLGALQAHGLIERSEDPEDKRRTIVRLTEAGRQAVENFFDTYSRSQHQ
jgi:CheY-like chemotaxis protein